MLWASCKISTLCITDRQYFMQLEENHVFCAKSFTNRIKQILYSKILDKWNCMLMWDIVHKYFPFLYSSSDP